MQKESKYIVILSLEQLEVARTALRLELERNYGHDQKVVDALSSTRKAMAIAHEKGLYDLLTSLGAII